MRFLAQLFVASPLGSTLNNASAVCSSSFQNVIFIRLPQVVLVHAGQIFVKIDSNVVTFG
jgi:hypothetical protein